MSTRKQLEAMHLDDLKKYAKEREIPGRSNLRKFELIDLIETYHSSKNHEIWEIVLKPDIYPPIGVDHIKPEDGFDEVIRHLSWSSGENTQEYFKYLPLGSLKRIAKTLKIQGYSKYQVVNRGDLEKQIMELRRPVTQTQRASAFCSDDGYILLGSYIDENTEMLIECSIHGKDKNNMESLRIGIFCKECQKDRGKFDSNVEFRVCRFLRQHGIDMEIHKVIPETRLSIDFYLPHYNLYLEVDGSQHWEFNEKFHPDESAFRKQKARDLEKTNWCKENKHMLFRWCGDELETFSDIRTTFMRAIAEKNPYYISHPQRYPHLQ